MPDEDPVLSEEFILRRIRPAWYASETEMINVLAFLPTSSDVDGLSVTRKQFSSAEAESNSPSGKRYHVAELEVGAVRSCRLEGIDEMLEVVGNRQENSRGHALIPQINVTRYKSKGREEKNRVKEWAAALVQISTMIFILPPED